MLKITVCKTYAEALTMAGKRASEFGKKPSANRLYAFCEDKLSMSLEREIASACGGGSFNVRVTTFSRFIHNHMAKKMVMLDKESSAMVVKNILLKKAAELSCFHKSAYNPGTAVTLYELIAQLKSAMVEPNDLKEGMSVVGGALKGKISDIATVYEEYETYVKNGGYYDSNSYLALMLDLLKEGNFKGCSAMLVCFGSLTRQGVEILKTLASVMENLDVFLLAGENSELYTNELKELIMREIDGFCEVSGDFSYGKERLSIMQNLFEPTFIKAQKTETDKVFYYEAVDCEDEINHIASIIRREVIGGARYRDMAIAVGNPANYKGVLSRVFSSYGIPFFLDDERILTSHPVARLVIEYLDMLRGNYRLRDCITFEKNPYFQKDKGVSDRFENFCLKNALTPKNIKSGLYPTKNDQETYGEDLETFENERKRLMQLNANCFTVEGFVDAIKGMLTKLGVKEEAELQAKKLKDYGDFAGSAFTLQAYEKTVGVLDSVCRILGDNRVSIADFRNILISGFTACKVSVLPQLSDAVYVGDYKECKYLEHKILFAGGLSGEVPFTKSDTAVLTDRDLTELENFNCIVEPKIRIVNKRERENVGATLLSFTDKLYLSRSATASDGKPLAKSRVIENVLSLFTKNGKPLQTYTATKIKKETERNQNMYSQMSAMRFNAPRPSMMEFISGATEFKAGAKPSFVAETAYFSVLRNSMPEECERIEGLLASGGNTIATYLEGNGNLIFKDDTLSASILESYFGCPFACFMQHGLKVEERETGDVKVNEFGSFLHDVLEHYVGEIKRGMEKGDAKITDKASSDAFVDGLIENLSQDHRYSRYLDTEKYKTVFALIGKEARRVAYAIFLQFKNSSFRPVATEASFGDGAKYPAIKLSTPYGEKKIKGKIDRVDRYGDYVRIIDYKTGRTHEDDESFYTGNNLQLYLYMNAFLGENDKPCGAYYFPVSDKFGEEGEYVYAVRGKTLLSEDVVHATDNGVSESSPESQVLNVKFSYKGGSFSARSKAVLGEEHFKAYVDYALMIAKKGAEEIEEGVIAPSPYENKCTFCKYAPVCGFDVASGAVRREKGVNEGTVFDAVEVENELHE